MGCRKWCCCSSWWRCRRRCWCWSLRLRCSCVPRACALARLSRVLVRLRAAVAPTIRSVAEWEVPRAFAWREMLRASPRADCPRIVIRLRVHIAKCITIVAVRELLRAHAWLSCCRRWCRWWCCTTGDFRRTIANVHLAVRTTLVLRTRAAPYLPSSRARINAVIGVRDCACRIRIRLHCQYQRTRSTTRNCQTFLNRRRHLVTTERQRHPIVRRRPFDRQQASIPCDARLLIIRRYDVICRINEPDVQIRLRHK